MTGLIKKLLANDKMRYLIAGGCTTLVNLITFYVLRGFTDLSRNICNTIAIIMAIVFAYFANKIFVFRSKTKGFTETVREALSFFGARIIAMLIEILSLNLLCDSFRIKEFWSKLLVQFIVVVVNYVMSRLFVFGKQRRSIKEILKTEYYCYVPFIITFVIMLVVFIVNKITPFGGNSLTIVDSLHQYLPFFSDYRDKLLNEGSQFYSWNIALGSNFMSLSAYYLSSPFNYLLMLVSKEYIAAAVCIIVSIKICLSASTMAYYLKHRSLSGNAAAKSVNNIVIIGLSLCYALSSYVIGYYWNVMWMDCILIFPLIILGFERLMEDNDPKMYALSLFYCLYCNYYIGYIICLFLIIWFIYYNHDGFKGLFRNGLRFALYSLISGGMAAFMLLPAYFGIKATAAAKTALPPWKWYGDFINIFKKMLFGTEPINSQIEDSGINLYCGMLAILTLFQFIFAKKIELSEKIRKVFILGILVISFNCEQLNYIWHGMHNQYGIPNRFSFLFIFVLLAMAYELMTVGGRLSVPRQLLSIGSALGFVAACHLIGEEGLTRVTLIGSCVAIGVYGIISMLRSARVIKRTPYIILIGAFCIIEMSYSGLYNFLNNGYAAYESYYNTTGSMTVANREIARLAAEQNAKFYRSELMDAKILDEATWHNMPSVGTFCSTVNGELVTTMGRLGFYTGANEFLYMGSTPFTNSLLGMKYLLHRDGELNNFAFEAVETTEGVGIYENPYPLSIGFGVSEDVKNWDRDSKLPLENQNDLAMAMTNEAGFFQSILPDLAVNSDTCSVSLEGNTVTYTPYLAGNASFIISFLVTKAGDYYVNCRGNYIRKIKFYIDGEELANDRYQIQIFHLGELTEGQYVSIEYCYENLGVSTYTASLYGALFNETQYQRIYGKLAENELRVTEFDDGYVSGTIKLDNRQTMFTSVPYDEGWTVFVDGKKTAYYRSLGAFIGIDMEPGEHTVTMKYLPKGLYPGMLISLISWLILLVIIIKSSQNNNTNLYKNTKNDVDQEKNI